MIEIKLKKRRILSSSSNSNEIYCSIILLIIYHTLKGKSKTIGFEYLNFAFHNIINNIENLDYDFVQSWEVNTLIKPITILLASYKLIKVESRNGRMVISITESGILHVEEMINEGLFNEIHTSTIKITKKLTFKKLKNSRLLW